MWRREVTILNSFLFNCTIYMGEKWGGCENVLVYSISKHNVCNLVTTGQDQMAIMKMLCRSEEFTGCSVIIGTFENL